MTQFCFLLGGSTWNGNIMKVTSVRKEDRGDYKCKAVNKLEVMKPKFIFSKL